jgi:hypothetical protein
MLLQSLFVNDLWDNGKISMNRANTLTLDNLVSLLMHEKAFHLDSHIKAISQCSMEKIITEINCTYFDSPQWLFFKLLVSSLSNLCPVQQLPGDATRSDTDQAGEFVGFINDDWYLNTWCSIITETYLVSTIASSYEVPMVTEKTVKAIIMLHPFVIVGSGQSHNWLNKLGFKTFEQSWFGLPPDGAIGNITLFERIYNLVQSIDRLSQLTQEELHTKWLKIVPDLKFNKRHLLNTDWSAVQRSLINDAE